MTDPIIEYNPDDDGILHINAANKGRTKLGKSLSNFAKYPFIHPKHGSFQCVEAYWYWILTDKQFDELRTISGYPAKQLGDELFDKHPRQHGFTPEEQEDILEALRCKLRQNKDLLNLLVSSTLPITHYNWYGKNGKYKVYYYPDYQWYIDEILRIRKVCQEKWKKHN